MIRTIFWFIAFWIYQFITMFFMLYYNYLGKRGKKQEQSNYLHKVTSRWARAMIRFAGGKVEVSGTENIPEDNVLFVSNHQGNFDIPVLIGYIPKLKGFVAKAELKKIPMVNKWMTELGCIFLDRKNPRQSIKAMSEGIEKLKDGHTLVIFPEGTRSKGNEMGEFKKGSMKLAIKANVPIVPITIYGTYKMLEEKKRITPAHVKINIHKPIYLEELSKEEKDELAEKVHSIIKDSLNSNK